MRFIKYLCGITLCLCALQAMAAKAPAPVVYNEDKIGIAVTQQQPEFVIQLKSNPSTGYSWFLRRYNSDLIEPVKHSYAAGNKGMAGSPGVETWTFKAKPAAFIVPQQTTIHFAYVRPWNVDDDSKEATFTVTTGK